MLLEELKATMENKLDESLCRICATDGSGNTFSIYSEQGELCDVVEKIGRCLPIIVLPTDTLTLDICSKCLSKLNASYELVITSLNSDAKLRAKFTLEDDASIEPAEEYDDYANVKQEHEFIEVKEEIYSDPERLSTLNDYKEGYHKHTSAEMTADSGGSQDHGETEPSSDAKKGIKILPDNETPALSIYGPATCDLCNVTFTDMEEFDEHVVSEHLQEHKFHCNRCDESFEQSQDLVMHKTTTHDEEPISCTQCQNNKEEHAPTYEDMEEEWLEESEIPSEEDKHPNGIADVCEVCNKRFDTEEMLKDHYLTHVSPQPVCNKCDLTFGSWYELSIHKKIHVRSIKEKRLVCNVCKKSFSERTMFILHRRSCMSKQYMCNICNRVFWRKYSLQLHMKTEKPYECACGMKFHTQDLLAAHKRTHKIEGVMKCVTCNKVFTNETFYKRHRYIHDPEFWDSFKCQVCQRPFRDAHALKNHMQLHDGVKPHMCDLCGRTYNRYANMLKHRKLHKPQNLWEHSCTQCESKFERLKDLMAHIEQVHTQIVTNSEEKQGDKKNVKWICRFCGKRISTKLSLQDHERIHTGAKPFICEWCGREFRSRPNLLQHHLTHTGDRRHACGICGKRFARKSFITQHMRVHTGEKPYECNICMKRFSQSGDMKRHRNRHNKNTEEGLALFVQLKPEHM